MAQVNGFVDCVSLACPSVYLKTIQKLADMQLGDVIEVITRSSSVDQLIINFRVAGHKVLRSTTDELGVSHIFVEKMR